MIAEEKAENNYLSIHIKKQKRVHKTKSKENKRNKR